MSCLRSPTLSIEACTTEGHLQEKDRKETERKATHFFKDPGIMSKKIHRAYFSLQGFILQCDQEKYAHFLPCSPPQRCSQSQPISAVVLSAQLCGSIKDLLHLEGITLSSSVPIPLAHGAVGDRKVDYSWHHKSSSPRPPCPASAGTPFFALPFPINQQMVLQTKTLKPVWRC